MVQVIGNLLGNALRHTSRGGEITLSAESAPGAVLFRVQDNGEGIHPDDLPYIFNRFYRGDKSRRQNGESGLGLAIARSIIEAHGGRISVQSTPGSGATFRVEMPVE